MKSEKKECRPAECRYRKTSDRFQEFYRKLYFILYPDKVGGMPYDKVSLDTMLQDIRKLSDSFAMLKVLYAITVIIMVIFLVYLMMEGL